MMEAIALAAEVLGADPTDFVRWSYVSAQLSGLITKEFMLQVRNL